MRGRGNSSPRVALRVASREQSRRFLGETHNMLLTETRVAVLNNEKCNTQQQRPTTREWVKFSVSNYQGYRRNLSLICRACSLILFLLIFRAICRSAAVGLVCLWVSLPSSSARCFACSFVVLLAREETLGGSVSRSLLSDSTVDMDAVEVNLTPFVCDTSTQNVTRCEHCRQPPNSIHKSIDFVL